MDCSINGGGTTGRTLEEKYKCIITTYTKMDSSGSKGKKSNIVKVVKENIAILKNSIGVGKAKARYITQKPQRLRAMTTLQFQNHQQ